MCLMNTSVRKFFNLLLIMLWAIGTIGGFGYCISIGEVVVAIAVLALGGMAFPTVKNCFWVVKLLK